MEDVNARRGGDAECEKDSDGGLGSRTKLARRANSTVMSPLSLAVVRCALVAVAAGLHHLHKLHEGRSSLVLGLEGFPGAFSIVHQARAERSV